MKKFTRERNEKISKALMGNKNRVGTAIERNRLKAGSAEYQRLHRWVRKNKLKTGICDNCKLEDKTYFANISGEYKWSLDDFIELCSICHKRFDINRDKNT